MRLLLSCGVGDFMSESSVYEDLHDMKSLKKFMETQQEDYNLTPGVVPTNLVLFRDAIEHSTSETQHTQPRTFACMFKTGQYTWCINPQCQFHPQVIVLLNCSDLSLLWSVSHF